jgi:hypothetical protein
MIRLARFLDLNYVLVYAPSEDALALHLARDEVTMACSMEEYLTISTDV